MVVQFTTAIQIKSLVRKLYNIDLKGQESKLYCKCTYQQISKTIGRRELILTCTPT